MEEVILLSSESEEDSDIEVIGVYSDTEIKAEATPFIRKEWVVATYTGPFVFDLTDQSWGLPLPPPRRRMRRDPSSPLEVVDLDTYCFRDEGDLEPVSPLSNGCKRTKTLSKFKGPHTRCSQKEEQLGEDPTVLEARDSDILGSNQGLLRESSTEPPEQENTMKCSDKYILKSPVKSPSLPTYKNPEEEACSPKLSGQITQESQQCSGVLEPLDGGCALLECPNSKNNTCQTNLNVISNEPQPISTVEEAHLTCLVSGSPHVEAKKREEPGSPQTLRDDALSLPPQSIGSPHHIPDNVDPLASSNDCSACEARHNDTYSPTHIPSGRPLSPSPPEDLTQRDPGYSNTSPTGGTATGSLELKHPEALSSPPSKPCSPAPDSDQQARLRSPLHPQPATGSVSPCRSLGSRSIKNLPNRTPTPTSKDILAGESSDQQLNETEADLTIVSPPYDCSVPIDPAVSGSWSEEMNEEPGHRSLETCSVGLNPVRGVLQNGSDGEDVAGDRVSCVVHKDISRVDRRYVCPIQYKKLMTLMAGPVQSLDDEEEEDDGFGDPEQLCRQSLSLVYSTIEENYPEGTLQLLSDLLHPRFYPPIDITSHLLRGILLDHQSQDFLCQEAYNLLMRTQRHHQTDKTTIPWDWELLVSVMAEQNLPRRHRCEVVRMLLQYVLQTLEDDFRVKISCSDLHHSIAKTTLSCDLRFTQVRDVIDWLFAAVMKSTGDRANVTADTEVKAKKDRNEHIEMVAIFQKMLSLALEVDRSPALSASKLCQELFQTLISSVPLRQHRMLLLKTMESRLLRCKLLELLLGHACLQKTPLPMSLSLLLHFLKNSTLAPDPTDGAEGWRRWEELIQLLWMLLLSYREVMKGHLRCSVTERAGYSRAPIQTVNDTLSRSSVQDAVEAFLSRSQADLGQALPPHIHESLTYLQNHLLDSCQH